MEKKTKGLLEDLKTAMQAELTGYEFYKTAAATTTDSEGKHTFEELAAEERSHFEFLQKHYESLLDTGSLAKGSNLGKGHKRSTQHPIFSAQLKERIQEAHFEMSALAIAVQLEANSIQYYQAMAARAPDAIAKQFFGELADWETGHHDALVAQQKLLQESYWGTMRFSPF